MGPTRSPSARRPTPRSSARLRAAGAIVVGKTTMPELGLWPFTESVTWGVTRNPWDAERTPGGSSGGSAAAVAAGLVPAALAVDGAGSIRIPAACCGLFGLKPQRGRVPRAPHDRDGSHWIVLRRAHALRPRLRDHARRAHGVAGTFEPPPAAPSGPRCGSPSPSAFPPGVRGTPGAERPRRAATTPPTLLRALGHTVVERDVDFRAARHRVILGLLFRGDPRLRRRGRAPAAARAPHPRVRPAGGARLRPHCASGCSRPSGGSPTVSGGSSTSTTSC